MRAAVTVFVALGSNLDGPMAQVCRATEALGALPDTRLVKVSPWYQSQAVGPGEQEDYINGVAELVTQLEPLALLDELQAIEHNAGRQRLIHWGPRTLDLDILLYGDAVISVPRLVIPHPYLGQRNFVVMPLFDLAPHLQLPNGDSLARLYQQLGHEGLTRLTPEP